MSQHDTNHAWWSRLRHQGLLLSPVVMLERYPDEPEAAAFPLTPKLRDAYIRFSAHLDPQHGDRYLEQNAILKWADALLVDYLGHTGGRIARQGHFTDKLTTAIRIGSRTETLHPHRVVFADATSVHPALLVMADTSPRVGRGRGRTSYARFLELLRGTGHRLGLLTNGLQVRLVYAGLDFESWCEWETDRWFDDGEGSQELAGLRQLLSPKSLALTEAGTPSLLDAVEESRKRQADLSSVLRENVRQAVELLLEEVSAASRTDASLFNALSAAGSDRPLTDTEAQEALLQAAVRVVMRLVVCLFAESRGLLPVNDPVYAASYGVRSLYELLDETHRDEGGEYGLLNRRMAYSRLTALFRLIHGGSAHGSFPMKGYGGLLFRPGDAGSADAVARALHTLEHAIAVRDATVYRVLRLLLRGPLPVLRGRVKTFVDGPVDYTDLRTEFIGLIYEGLLDYRLKRTNEQTGPQIFLNIGREPVLPLARLEDMLANDRTGLKDLLTTLRKEKVTATVASEDEGEAEEEAEEPTEAGEETAEETAEPTVEPEAAAVLKVDRTQDYLDADARAKQWAREAVMLAGLVPKKTKKQSDTEYKGVIDAEANRLIRKVVANGEFYLVRAGNTRKGTGTFYTRPQLAVPTVHRTLEPLCYDRQADGTLVPKPPEVILGLKVCDPACGSASFLVGALHYLTDALYASLCHHCSLEDPASAQRITLPYGRPRTGSVREELVPFPPDDPQRGDTFADRVKALLRRHVVERCIYGVDINPLAIEFARVSLWIETLDEGLPFTFLDHKIKVGNSLVGCWLDRVLDYPIRAWERNGGDDPDAKHIGLRTERIETFLNGKKIGKRRMGDGLIKREMCQIIESRFTNQPLLFTDATTSAVDVVAEARAAYERLHEMPVTDPDAREAAYRDLQHNPAVGRLKQAMDEWCAICFWPMDEHSAEHVPTPLGFHASSADRDPIIRQLAEDVRFFHWEVEFPDAFTPSRSGFDAAIGNPPWDVMKPNSQEFFTDYDPIYRTYDKQSALRRQRELFEADPAILQAWDDYKARFKALSNWAACASEPFDVTLAKGKDGKSLQGEWTRKRTERKGFASPDHPYRLQGSADLNSYKMFAEVFWNLLQSDGRLGVILPTGIYSDFGTRGLREALLFKGRLDFLYAFQNEQRVFVAAHHAYKQTALFASKGGSTVALHARFRMGVGDSPHAQEIPDDILKRDHAAMRFTPDDVRLNSPKTLSLVELRTPRDAAIFRQIYHHSVRIGANTPGWEITYTREFDMTNDSKLFPPLEKWEAMGYKPDVFGRWIGPDGKVALPLCEGRMIGQFDLPQKGWVSGKGRTAKWRVVPLDDKRFEPQFLMAEHTYVVSHPTFERPKIAFMDVTASTNTRTFVGSPISRLPGNHKAPMLSVADGDLRHIALLASICNSLSFDFMLRARFGSTSLGWFILEELPIPKAVFSEAPRYTTSILVVSATRLSFLHRRFAPEWLHLKHLYPQLGEREWKHRWAVTESDRLRLRVEIDALCADLYGLEPDDFDWIVRDDPTDPKGFYRVDRNLPFRERLTGLAAAAFRAFKEGKWTAESAATKSNDEFFETIGIPEMTSPAAAKAKGLDAPLIMSRKGCHAWHPENFAPDDPRYGWTWEHCWQDAIALLGSEEAVEGYVARGGRPTETNKPDEDQPSGKNKEAFKLRSDDRPRQGRLF